MFREFVPRPVVEMPRLLPVLGRVVSPLLRLPRHVLLYRLEVLPVLVQGLEECRLVLGRPEDGRTATLSLFLDRRRTHARDFACPQHNIIAKDAIQEKPLKGILCTPDDAIEYIKNIRFF